MWLFRLKNNTSKPVVLRNKADKYWINTNKSFDSALYLVTCRILPASRSWWLQYSWNTTERKTITSGDCSENTKRIPTINNDMTGSKTEFVPRQASLNICQEDLTPCSSPSWVAKKVAASQEIPCIMELEVSLPHSQQPATCPYPAPDKSTPCPPPQPTSWRSIFILSSHLLLGLQSGLFSSGFPTETLYATLFPPIRTTCPAHLILLDLITRIIFGKEYRTYRCLFPYANVARGCCRYQFHALY